MHSSWALFSCIYNSFSYAFYFAPFSSFNLFILRFFHVTLCHVAFFFIAPISCYSYFISLFAGCTFLFLFLIVFPKASRDQASSWVHKLINRNIVRKYTLKGLKVTGRKSRESWEFFFFFFFLLLLNKMSLELDVTKIQKSKFRRNLKSRTYWSISCFVSC